MESKHMLTTFDNPFNPFVDFSSWYMFDCEKGYNTCSRLARIANINSEMTEKEINDEKERAMLFITKYDFENKFVVGTEKQIDELIKRHSKPQKIEENNESSVEIDEKLKKTAKSRLQLPQMHSLG